MKKFLMALVLLIGINANAATKDYKFSGHLTDVYDPHGVIGEGYSVPIEVRGNFTVDLDYYYDPVPGKIYSITEFIMNFADHRFSRRFNRHSDIRIGWC